MNEKLHHEDDETILISYRELIHNFFREVKHFWWLILIATVGMAVGMFLYALFFRPMKVLRSFIMNASDIFLRLNVYVRIFLFQAQALQAFQGLPCWCFLLL